jgi:hypothetical protein
VTFGFVFTIGIAMLLANLVGSGITCPRCFTRNRGSERLRDLRPCPSASPNGESLAS